MLCLNIFFFFLGGGGGGGGEKGLYSATNMVLIFLYSVTKLQMFLTYSIHIDTYDFVLFI